MRNLKWVRTKLRCCGSITERVFLDDFFVTKWVAADELQFVQSCSICVSIVMRHSRNAWVVRLLLCRNQDTINNTGFLTGVIYFCKTRRERALLGPATQNVYCRLRAGWANLNYYRVSYVGVRDSMINGLSGEKKSSYLQFTRC